MMILLRQWSKSNILRRHSSWQTTSKITNSCTISQTEPFLSRSITQHQHNRCYGIITNHNNHNHNTTRSLSSMVPQTDNNNDNNNNNNNNNNNSHHPLAKTSSDGVVAIPIDFDVASKIEGDESQIVIIEIEPNQIVRAESGAMLYMTQGIHMETTTAGGLSAGFKRMLTGQNLMISDFSYQGDPGTKGEGMMCVCMYIYYCCCYICIFMLCYIYYYILCVVMFAMVYRWIDWLHDTKLFYILCHLLHSCYIYHFILQITQKNKIKTKQNNHSRLGNGFSIQNHSNQCPRLWWKNHLSKRCLALCFAHH